MAAGIESQNVDLQQNECYIEVKAKQANLEKTIEMQEMEIISCKQQITDLELKENLKLDEMQKLEKRFEIQTEEYRNLVEVLHEKMEKRFDKMDKSCDEFRTKLDDMEKKYSAICKTEKSAQLQVDAKSKFGYEMRLKFSPNDVKDVEKTYLSIYFDVIKGENDAILKWPNKCTGLIAILDQLNDKATKFSSKIRSFDGCLGKSPFDFEGF
uniref:TRAF1-6 MATH domain-containing protein n=1 Tax=Strigamia maritima TaxID=126957 RepID=T1IS06_STRMM